MAAPFLGPRREAVHHDLDNVDQRDGERIEEVKHYKVLLLNFCKPDSEGQNFEAPVDLSRLNPNVTVDFGPINIGRVIEANQDDDELTAILELQEVPCDFVPVVGFATPVRVSDLQGKPRNGVWRCISIIGISLIERSKAQLPSGFYMEEIGTPPLIAAKHRVVNLLYWKWRDMPNKDQAVKQLQQWLI